MRRTLIHIAFAAALVVASVATLLLGLHYHRQYGEAHAAADTAVQAGDPAAGSGEAPETPFTKAQWCTVGTCAIAVVALFVGWRTRHPAWLLSLVCVAIAVVAVVQTGLRS